ncbi:oligopeptidase A [Gilvimarinus sp. F26214L]|uniref:oligopeptidase A n=1 Tax=Gilvimarinus sp. DZF01 TaxID=3461371 RepID=UPI004045921F
MNNSRPDIANSNPLLAESELPLFDRIKAEHVIPAIETILAANRQELAVQLNSLDQPSYEELVVPFEEREDRLSQAWSPVSHLNAVMNSPELRQAYAQAQQELTAYSTELAQNEQLFRAFEALAARPDFSSLSVAQQKTVTNSLRDFRLAGVALAAEEKRRYGEIKKRLSELSTRFANNVLDATQGWYKTVTDPGALSGLPETALEGARQAAKSRGLEGYVITLDAPAYIAVMTYADDRALREEVYQAFVTRASAEGLAVDGKDPAEWDNQALMEEILALRHELAQLLGFANYAERSLATKMADSTDEVLNFLQRLARTSRKAAEQELAELKQFARQEFGMDELAAWDVAYYSEKRRQAVFDLSEEELRPFFPADTVLEGLFQVAGRLFNVRIVPDPEVTTWHPDARFYRVTRDGTPLAGFYLDLYARENKRGGAWMDECRVRRKSHGELQLPVAYLTCNFTPPADDRPSLLTHSEVTTLFHEFGHGLHHMLTQIDCPAVSGINGVAWDAVELPSQFLENWCWQESVIPLISSHYQTGEALPRDLLDKLLKAKNFQTAMQMVRQLEFALFDFRLHLEYDPDAPRDIQSLLDEVRREVAVMPPPSYNKFQNSFSHIFAGGYAAGYYSYKWAEVLSSDAFSSFEEHGIFDSATAQSFLHNILEKGGSEDAMDLFVKFRGREPQVDALLRHSGIEEHGEQAL